MLFQEQLPAPVNVEGIQPIMVDRQRIFHVLNTVVPTAGHKQGLICALHKISNQSYFWRLQAFHLFLK